MDFKRLLSEMGYAAGLPGLGISEPFGTPYSPYQTPKNVYGNTSGLLAAGTGKAPSTSFTPSNRGLTVSSQGDVKGISTNNNSNGPGAGYNYDSNGTKVATDVNRGGGNADAVALAEMARRNRINAAKSQAANLRSEGQSTFDNILKSINAFRERSNTLKTNAGQEIVNRASSILGSNARTGRELEGETRARGRALGLGDSSKFINQNKLASNLAATQGNTRARQGEEDRANSALFDERQDQAQTQEDNAGTYLKGINDRATTVENTGYDSGEEIFGNALNDIVNYQRTLATINPNTAGLTQYSPDFSGITSKLSSVLDGASGGQTTEDNFANPATTTNIMDILRKKGFV